MAGWHHAGRDEVKGGDVVGKDGEGVGGDDRQSRWAERTMG